MNTPGHELALPMHQFIFLWNQNIADKPEWFLFISCRGFCPSHYCKLIIMLKCPLCAKRWEGKCPPLIILQEGKCPNPAKNRGGEIVLPTWFEQGGKCPGGEMSGYPRNGVKYRWTESNLRLFIWVLTEPPLDAFRLLVRSEHVNLSITKYTYTQRISEVTYCDCKFSKHDGLETYIVPGQMFTTWVSFRYKLVRTIYTIAVH